jgi:hypothetical protein
LFVPPGRIPRSPPSPGAGRRRHGQPAVAGQLWWCLRSESVVAVAVATSAAVEETNRPGQRQRQHSDRRPTRSRRQRPSAQPSWCRTPDARAPGRGGRSAGPSRMLRPAAAHGGESDDGVHVRLVSLSFFDEASNSSNSVWRRRSVAVRLAASSFSTLAASCGNSFRYCSHFSISLRHIAISDSWFPTASSGESISVEAPQNGHTRLSGGIHALSINSAQHSEQSRSSDGLGPGKPL